MRSTSRRVRNTGIGVAAVGATAVLAPLTWGPSATAAPIQAATPRLVASPGSGLPGDPLTVRGSGCADGIVTLRIDGQSWAAYPTGDADGNWSAALTFPGVAGTHEIDGDCSDFTTVGAPTTFYGPGELRFTYAAVAIQTEAPQLVDPTVAAPTAPTPPSAPAPPAAAPAAPTQAASHYTG